MGKRSTLYDHINYRLNDPLPGDDVVSYTLRCAAELLSPPKEPGEDQDIECKHAAEDILHLHDHVKSRWEDHERETGSG